MMICIQYRVNCKFLIYYAQLINFWKKALVVICKTWKTYEWMNQILNIGFIVIFKIYLDIFLLLKFTT